MVVFGTSTKLLAQALDSEGVPPGPAQPVISEPDNFDHRTQVTWNDGILGVLSKGSGNYQFARFAWEGADTVPKKLDTVPVPIDAAINAPRLVKIVNGGWLLHATLQGKSVIYRFSDKGALRPPMLTNGQTDWINGATASGEHAAAIWQMTYYDTDGEFSGSGFEWATWTGPNMDAALTARRLWPDDTFGGGSTQAFPAEQGFLFLMRPRSRDVNVQRVSSSGETICGPSTITNSGLPAGIDGEIYGTDNLSSAFYLIRDNSGDGTPWAVLPVPFDCDVNCVLSGEVKLELDNFSITSVALASGPGGHLIAAYDSGKLGVRTFGNSFCDDAE